MTDPWRQRCPKGHSSLTAYEDAYKCSACGEAYHGEPYDAAEHEFPIDEEPRAKNIHEELLKELVRRCQDPTTEWLRARQFECGTPKQVGRTLAELEDDDLVERSGSGSAIGHLWRPTEKGRRRVIECERKLALEAGPANGERAKVDPVATGLLSLFVALVLLSGYALAMGAVL